MNSRYSVVVPDASRSCYQSYHKVPVIHNIIYYLEVMLIISHRMFLTWLCLIMIDGIGGRGLDPACGIQVNPRHVSNKVLGWYFPLSVLANSRGARELTFGYDLLRGANVMGEIPRGLHARERLELQVVAELGV